MALCRYVWTVSSSAEDLVGVYATEAGAVKATKAAYMDAAWAPGMNEAVLAAEVEELWAKGAHELDFHGLAKPGSVWAVAGRVLLEA